MKILISGDRNVESTTENVQYIQQVILKYKKQNENLSVLSGGCKGVDTIAADICIHLDIPVRIFMAQWSLGRQAGPIRNARMLEENPDIIVAIHPCIMESRGTKDMINKGIKKKVPCHIYDMKSNEPKIM